MEKTKAKFAITGLPRKYLYLVTVISGMLCLVMTIAKIFGLFHAKSTDEFLASRMSDRAEILFKFGFRHADARVFYGDRARVFVERNGDEQVVFCDRDRRVGEALEIELVDRIRGVRDKFAQEDLTIRVDRVDHEVE